MGLPARINVTGIATGSPASSSAPNSLGDQLDLGTQQTYQVTASGRPSVNSTDMSPFVLGLQTIVKVFFIACRIRGSLKILLTSENGDDQVIPCSDMFVWSAPQSNNAITAIKFVGTADLEFFIAGNTG